MSELFSGCRLKWLGRRVLFFLCLAGSVPQVFGQPENMCNTLVVSGNPEYPPLLWRPADDPSTLTGAVPALLQEIVEPLGITVQVRDLGSWARVLHQARTGELDLVAGAFVTDERQAFLDYVMPPITWKPTNIWVARGREFNYRYWSDLRGKRGATLINNSFGQDFDAFADEHLTIEGIRTIEQSFRMAKLGRVDYVLYEHLQGHAKLAKLGLEDEFVDLLPPISSEALHFAFPKNSVCNTEALREVFAKRVAEVTAERRIDRLAEEYTERYLDEE